MPGKPSNQSGASCVGHSFAPGSSQTLSDSAGYPPALLETGRTLMPPPYQLDAPQCTVHNQCCCWLLLTVHLLLFSILHLLLLQCTDYMKNNPLVKMTDSVSVSWNSEFVRWVATTGIASGQLQCGDRIYLRNRRNGMGVMAFVVARAVLLGLTWITTVCSKCWIPITRITKGALWMWTGRSCHSKPVGR